eukprot:NODE_249_length_12946_cov_0.357438.p7 type:complete len:315 gc:universal NODE_249_length_12946_cov_0.357438:9206-8262(-)
MNYHNAASGFRRDSDNSSSETSSSDNSVKEIARNKSMEFKIQSDDKPILRFRKSVFLILTDPKFGIAGAITSTFLATSIIWCAVSFSLETVWSLNSTPKERLLWKYNELAISVIFTLEYFLRIVFFPSFKWIHKYIFSVSWMIDLFTILPFFLTIFFEDTNQALIGIIRLSRILRMFRLLKISQHTQQVQMVFEALKRSRDAVLMLVFLITNCLFLYGSCVYYAELAISTKDSFSGILFYTEGELAGQRSEFQSIPDSMWWAMVTLTTVIMYNLGRIWGYGSDEFLGQINCWLYYVYRSTSSCIPHNYPKYEYD